MEKTTYAWIKKGILALLTVLLAGCCIVLAGCGQSAEESIREVIANEFDEMKNRSTEQLEGLSGTSAQFAGLSQPGVTSAEVFDAIFSDFDYRIESIEVDGDRATVGIVFITKDMSGFYEEFNKNGTKAAENGEINSQEDVGKIFLETIRGLPTQETGVVEFEMVESAGTWKLANDFRSILSEALYPKSIMSR